MTYEQNLRAILDTHLPEIKDEIKDSIIDSILRLKITGQWIRITNGAMKEIYMCSVCHRVIEDSSVHDLIPIKYPYCHCGAKMEVEDAGSN